MEEIIEQYKAAKKWRREMFIAMIIMLALMVVMIVVGFVIKALLPLFIVFGIIVGALGVTVNVIAANTFKKAHKLVKDYLTSRGKTEAEINSILGGTAK
ncbi:MAG: hypothetical protein HDT43_01955 [Ruminococcaceae bacterium]|nr:hypothetical protein [Oscillospiraceae bacterium]